MKAASSPAHSQACNGMLPWRNRQRVRLLTERLVVRAHPGANVIPVRIVASTHACHA